MLKEAYLARGIARTKRSKTSNNLNWNLGIKAGISREIPENPTGIFKNLFKKC